MAAAKLSHDDLEIRLRGSYGPPTKLLNQIMVWHSSSSDTIELIRSKRVDYTSRKVHQRDEENSNKIRY